MGVLRVILLFVMVFELVMRVEPGLHVAVLDDRAFHELLPDKDNGKGKVRKRI